MQNPGHKILTATPNLQFTPVSITDSSMQTIHKHNYLQGGMELLTPISETNNENTSGLCSRRHKPLNAENDLKVSEEDVEI